MSYFYVALFLSLKDNIPRMVSLKNSIGLFMFTLLFFEFVVLAFIFWIVYVVLSYFNTPICQSFFCTGLMTGLVAYINLVSAICLLVVIRSWKYLGIAWQDAFGANIN